MMDILISACMLLGFYENCKHVVINAGHELMLIRACNANNYVMEDLVTEPLELSKVANASYYVERN